MKLRVWRNLVIDLLLTGAALVLFALFHHVLPRQQESIGIVIPNPNASVVEETVTGRLDNMELLAAGPTSGIVSDTGTSLLAKGGSRNNTRQNKSGSGSSSKGGSALTEETEEPSETETESTVSMAEKF